MDAKEVKVRELIGKLEAIADIHPTDFAGIIANGADTLRALLAENAKLKGELAALLNEKGE